MTNLLISEIYGPVWQGEGRSRGQLAAFVRLGGCNLSCTWCDTPYTWAFDARHAAMHADKKQYDPKKELRRISIKDFVGQVDYATHGRKDTQIIFSGGEPLLQGNILDDYIEALQERGYWDFHGETAGTIIPQDYQVSRVNWTVSPKLETSGNSFRKRNVAGALSWFATHYSDFKFVVTSEVDFEEVSAYVVQYNLNPNRVWIMPEGRTAEEHLNRAKDLAPSVLKRGWNLTLRDHVLLYDDKRGV